ncbi:MAG TPA: sortase [Candidatus Limnocylindrales bacterium]|nr:sortase [Candidatus Limnocylindrales bacterium]
MRPAPTEAAKSAPKAAAARTSTRSTRPSTKRSAPRATAYRGTNRMWMPALGINHSVASFPCSRTTPPGLGVYRWGCAGANNVYLLAHAYAAFKPLHDAYVRGRLRTGMKVMYADAAGRVRTYAISWWRLTTPDKGGFAYAAQSRPSMTLQTCVGAHSEYRLIVRLTEVG